VFKRFSRPAWILPSFGQSSYAHLLPFTSKTNIMKKYVMLAAMSLSCLCAFSQDHFVKGTKLLDLNIGLGSPYWSSGLKNTLPINPRVGLEVGVTDEISVGGSVAYSGAKYEYNILGDQYTWKYNAWFIALRGAYHFELENEKLDPYVGASLGYVVVSVSGDDSEGSTVGSGAGYGAFGGIRYYIQNNLGLNAELGYSSFSFLNIGVTLKL
jgi:opacity protein-like surface antigen